MIILSLALSLLAIACALKGTRLAGSNYLPNQRKGDWLITAALILTFAAGAAFHLGILPWI